MHSICYYGLSFSNHKELKQTSLSAKIFGVILWHTILTNNLQEQVLTTPIMFLDFFILPTLQYINNIYMMFPTDPCPKLCSFTFPTSCVKPGATVLVEVSSCFYHIYHVIISFILQASGVSSSAVEIMPQAIEEMKFLLWSALDDSSTLVGFNIHYKLNACAKEMSSFTGLGCCSIMIINTWNQFTMLLSFIVLYLSSELKLLASFPKMTPAFSTWTYVISDRRREGTIWNGSIISQWGTGLITMGKEKIQRNNKWQLTVPQPIHRWHILNYSSNILWHSPRN